MKRTLGIMGVVLGCAAVQVAAATKSPKGEEPRRSAAAVDPRGPTEFQIRNVDFRIDDSVVLEIRWLRGQLLPNKPGKPPIFDDRNSLLMKIDAGEVAMSTASFTDLMNRYVFNYPGAPLTNIRVSTEGDLLRQEATMHKTVPTEMIGPLAALPDGRIRFRPTTIRTAGIPSKGLMDAIGLKTDKLVKGTDPRGVDIAGDDLIMDLNVLMPPPRVRAKVTAVRIEGDRIVQTFGRAGDANAGTDLTPPDSTARNYLYYRGGTVRMRKLIMEDADMQVVDADPSDPLDFSLEHYFAQVVAGQSRNMPNGAQITAVPDYHDLDTREKDQGTANGKTKSE